MRPPVPANDNSRAGFMPRGLSRVDAAAYIGIGTTTFDEMVRDGRMPSPRVINSRTVWCRFEIDAAFDDLPRRGTANPWDEDDSDHSNEGRQRNGNAQGRQRGR